VGLRADDLASAHATHAPRTGRSHSFAGQLAGLLHLSGELSFVELVAKKLEAMPSDPRVFRGRGSNVAFLVVELAGRIYNPPKALEGLADATANQASNAKSTASPTSS
jgi:hypothetical protein